MHGFSSRYWGTFEQWKKLGGKVQKRPAHVKPGQWGTNIVFFRQIKKSKVDAFGEEKIESFPLMRFYTVFNLDQVDGETLDRIRPSSDTGNDFPDFAEADRVIAASGAEIKYGGNRAVYTRPVGTFPHHDCGDFIRMPERHQFNSPHEFYATAFHELTHWSEICLDWEGSYALGELIAEMAGCFLCAQTNIPCSDDLTNHTSYVGSWLKELKNDRKFIFKAAAQASKATEFILKFSRVNENVPELETVEI